MFTTRLMWRVAQELSISLIAMALVIVACLALPSDASTARGEKHRVELGVIVIDQKGELTITHVIAGSPAAEAGMRVLDQIVAINGKPITTEAEMVRELQLAADQGDSTQIDIRRDGQMGQVTVNLQREKETPIPLV